MPGSRISAGEWPWKYECSAIPCNYVCAYSGSCPADGSCPNEEPCCQGETSVPLTFVGFVEGACYNNCGYYRAARNCMMKDIEMPFCPGCIVSTRNLLKDEGIPRCREAGPPPSTGTPEDPRTPGRPTDPGQPPGGP